MNIRSSVLLLAIAAVVSGCAASSSEVVKPLPEALAKNGFVQTVDIKAVPANVSPDFQATLLAGLQNTTKACATGAQPLRLEVNVVQFKAQNAAATILIGDSNLIKGSARLVDPASNEVVGDYEITRSIGGGGIFAALAMAGPESSMSDAFAQEICKQAFGRDPSAYSAR
jgi:hypothetical protein